MTVPGDRTRVSVLVEVEPSEAFQVFTMEIDSWWRHGLKYRIGRARSLLALEPKLGGRLFETFHTKAGERTRETGRVTVWEPPSRLVFEWRAVNFKDDEKTEVEVSFEASRSGTLVTVEHRGWSRIRPDHPVRHGQGTSDFIRTMGTWWGDLMSSFRERVLCRKIEAD
jgi:uncharacterized protein YndB with AHSA1/START domain